MNCHVKRPVSLLKLTVTEELRRVSYCDPCAKSCARFRAEERPGSKHLAIKQVLKGDAVALKRIRIDVGQVVGDRVDIELLGLHAGSGDIERIEHCVSP